MMRSVRVQARVLALALIVIGLASIFHQVHRWQVPLTEDQTTPVWTIDARVSFDARPGRPLKVRMFVPPLDDGFEKVDESFISNNYGATVSTDGGNREVTWSARRGDGQQNLYYRLVIRPDRLRAAAPPAEGPQFRTSPALEGAEAVAVNALLRPIREHSADVETFIGETIKRVNDGRDDDNVRLLLGDDHALENRARIVNLLLAAGHIPTEMIHTLALRDNALVGGQQVEPGLWLRSYNGTQWLYFNLEDGRQELPADHIVWWRGEEPLLTLEGGRHASTSFSTHAHQASTLQLAQALHAKGRRSFIDFSLYEVPIPTQQLFRVILMIPIGVLIVVLVRSMIGIETLGTFTPVLIALAFRETEVVAGIILFTAIAAAGLSVRSYLEFLKLQRMARLAVMLVFVVAMMIGIGLVSHKLGFNTGLSVGLFPMVILTMVIERIAIAWEERGGGESMKLAVATLATAVVCHLVMIWRPLRYLVFTFPGTLLILAALIVLLGHYRGYRLTELLRFRTLAEEERA